MEDGDSDSDSCTHDFLDSTKAKQDEAEYYDPIYFDSDEDDEGVDEDNDSHVESSNRNLGGQSHARADTANGSRIDHHDMKMETITHGLQASTLEASSPSSLTSPSTTRSKKKSKRDPTLSDADLYDPDEDDIDQNWLMKKIAGKSRGEESIRSFPSLLA